MKDIKISLRQIEKTDINQVLDYFNSPFKNMMNLPASNIHREVLAWIANVNDSENDRAFAIIAQNSTDVYMVGLCGLLNIDWVSRSAQLLFMMIDQGKYSCPIQNFDATKSVLGQILSFGFQELNLNKIWLEIIEGDSSAQALKDFNFIHEGTLKRHYFKAGNIKDADVYSLMAAEYREKL